MKKTVITGGPGAGKTAVLELAKRNVCEHVSVLPESAGILFGGGFWRRKSVPARKAAQRAIFYLQREVENLVEGEGRSSLALCDRGTLDGLAYWPADENLFWKELNTSREEEYAKYEAVIHLRTPLSSEGYNNFNPLRIETDIEAREIDERIAQIWMHHPNYVAIDSQQDFLVKIAKTNIVLNRYLPKCCINKTAQESELKEKLA